MASDSSAIFSSRRASARFRASSTLASSMLLGTDGHVGQDLDAVAGDHDEPFADCHQDLAGPFW